MRKKELEIGMNVTLKDLILFKAKSPFNYLWFQIVNFGGNYAFITDNGERIFKVLISKIIK